MSLRIAINGFGRIGRNLTRACFEQSEVFSKLDIVAINDVGSLEALAHLLQFDSTHGSFKNTVQVHDSKTHYGLEIDGKFIAVSHDAIPEQCPWKTLNIDVVVESTGLFRSRADAAKHIQAGAKKVLIAAVAFDEVDATVVMGINETTLLKSAQIISASSCTTHCLAPVLNLLDEHFGIEHVFVTEMHAYTSDQHILDHVHRDLRRARAGAQNLIPTTTSSISALQQVLPQLKNKIDGYSMRVPVNNVAAVDLTVVLAQSVGVETVNTLFKEKSDGKFLGFTTLPLVSSDFNHRSESAIFDATQTKVLSNMVKLLVWYDNEWGYANRLLDLMNYIEKE